MTKSKKNLKKKKQSKNLSSFQKMKLFYYWWQKKTLFSKIFLCGLLIFFLASLYIGWCILTLPNIESAKAVYRKPIVNIIAENGEIIATYGDLYGNPVDLKLLPKYVPEAILATEDHRFFWHAGIDPIGIARALYTNLIQGKRLQGGSTITQQVAKNLFLTFDKTIKRKIQEMMLAIWLEYNLTKEQILTLYLNRVYLGSGTYGIDAAAKRYFDKPAEELTLYQAAVLAGILKAPSKYNPAQYPKAAKNRAKIVLNKMVENGFISREEALKAILNADNETPKNKTFSNNRYFSDWIIAQAEDYLGEIDRDINIFTTFRPDIQKITEKALQDNINSWPQVNQGAAIVLDYDGAVLAMMGGIDYNKSQFNRTTQAKRQPASTVKPFVYLSAFENGFTPDDVIVDKPFKINGWLPKNNNGKYYGPISLQDALILSLNTVPVILADNIGIKTVHKLFRRFGIADSKCPVTPASILGSCEISLLKLTAAYASLADNGNDVRPFGIIKITTKDDTSLYERLSSSGIQIANKKNVEIIKNILRKVVDEGTGKEASLNFPVYGKTGTSQNNRDAWFIGFSDNLVAGVWVGNDDESPMPRVYGGNLPAKIWRLIVGNSSRY